MVNSRQLLFEISSVQAQVCIYLSNLRSGSFLVIVSGQTFPTLVGMLVSI